MYSFCNNVSIPHKNGSHKGSVAYLPTPFLGECKAPAHEECMMHEKVRIHHHRGIFTIDSVGRDFYRNLSMVTDDTQPLTKADGRHILELLSQMVTKEDAKGFATKEDLKGFATKDDLKGFATKDDLKEFATKDDLKGFPTKDDLAAMERRLLDHVNFLDERNRKDYFDMLEIRYDQHDVRISRLEQHTGISPR
jgi:hypothetical protein